MLKKIKNRLRSKDAKTLIENFISLSSLQLIGMVLPLITLPYILRVIGFDKYGIIVFAGSLIAYFQSLTDFSFRITAVRDVAVFKNSPKKLNLIYSKVLIIKGLFLIISLFLITIIVLLYPPFREQGLIYGLSTLMLIGYALFPEWFFQGIEKMRYITYLNLGIKIFFTLCVFIFIRSEKDFWIYPLLQSAGLIGAALVGQLILIYKYKLKFLWLPKRIITNTIKTNFPLFINQFVPTLYNNTSVFLLGMMGTDIMVGIYQAILTIVNLGITLLDIISRVCFPYLNRKKDSFKKYKKLMLVLATIICVVILLIHKVVFWYLNITDGNAFIILLILTIGLFGYALSNIFGLNFFIIRRQDKLVMKNTIVASLVGFTLAFPLIFYYGNVGAAINITIARCIMGGGLFIKYIQYKNNSNRSSLTRN